MAADPRPDDGSGGAAAAPFHGHLPGGPDLHDLDLRRHPVRHAGAPPRPLRPLVGAAAPREPVPLQRRAPGRGHELSVRHRLGAVGLCRLGGAARALLGRGAMRSPRCSCWRCSSAICSRSASTASELLAFETYRLWARRRPAGLVGRLVDFVATGVPFLPALAAADHRPDLGIGRRARLLGLWGQDRRPDAGDQHLLPGRWPMG